MLITGLPSSLSPTSMGPTTSSMASIADATINTANNNNNVLITTLDDGEIIVHKSTSASDLTTATESTTPTTATTATTTSSVCSTVSDRSVLTTSIHDDEPILDVENSEQLKTSHSSSCSTGSAGLSVRFGDVNVREYERLPGDHPDVMVGLPITIGWAFKTKQPCTLEKYELKQSFTKKQRKSCSSSRNSKSRSRDTPASNNTSISTTTPTSVDIDGCDGTSKTRVQRLGSQARRKILEEFCTLEEIRMAERDIAKYRKRREKELLEKKTKNANGGGIDRDDDTDDVDTRTSSTSNKMKKGKKQLFHKMSSKIKNVFSSRS